MTVVGPERVYLSVSYSERQEAKALGARFDGDRKQWWVNRRDIAGHAGVYRWITDNPALATKAKAAFDFVEHKPGNTKLKLVNAKPPVATRASNFMLVTCACSTPPWDDCVHTVAPW